MIGPNACAIVGDGLAALTAYATLRHGGLEPAQIAVLGLDPDPVSTWRPRAEAIRQRRMRSESDGHCLPASFPGLAVRAALRRRTPAPLLRTVVDRYRPTVDEFLEHVEEVRARSGWDESFREARVERVRPTAAGFELEGARGSEPRGLGTFGHVLLAPGHPGLAFPAELEGDPRAVHAYEPHEYADEVAVVGAGMAAATEWLNALEAGASVVSVRRREPVRRPLNLPRPFFSKRGLAELHRAGDGQRLDVLARFSQPSYPPGRAWDEPLERAAREGRFRVAAELNGVAQVICATGFRKGWHEDPLLRQLVEDEGAPAVDRFLALDPDCTVPGLTDSRRTLAVAGVQAQWAYPAADTLVGMKYASRRFLRRVERCPTR